MNWLPFSTYIQYIHRCVCQEHCTLTLLHLNALGLEQVPQFLYLLLELPDEFGISVLVDHSLAHNLLGTIRIAMNQRERIRGESSFIEESCLTHRSVLRVSS